MILLLWRIAITFILPIYIYIYISFVLAIFVPIWDIVVTIVINIDVAKYNDDCDDVVANGWNGCNDDIDNIGGNVDNNNDDDDDSNSC